MDGAAGFDGAGDAVTPSVLVLADSLAFHGPHGPTTSDEPRLWPNIAAQRLGWRAELIAGSGWTARDGWWAMTRDPRSWTALRGTDALVLGLGSMDTLPSPLPTFLREGMRYLRPDGVRHRVRDAYLACQPALSRLLRRPVALPPRLSVRYLDDCLRAARALRPELPVVGVLPAVHCAPAYGHAHPGRGPAERALREWGRRRGVPMLDLPELIGAHVRGGDGNPDGMHWGWDGHRAVGEALARELARGRHTPRGAHVPPRTDADADVAAGEGV